MIGKKELIKDIKRVRNIINKVPTQRDYKKYGKHSITTFTNIKSWNKWLYEIFGEVNHNIRVESSRKISRDDLLNNLKYLYKKLGRVPKQSDIISKYSKYGRTGYKREFEGFSNALKEIGLVPNLKKQFQKKKLLMN